MLSLINPANLKDPGIYVDSNLKFEKESTFNYENIKWIFYGNPYEHVVMSGGSVKTFYGLEHSWGYIESIENPDIKQDVIYGLLIDRVDSEYTDYDSDYDSDSDFGLNYKKDRPNNFENCEIYVDENNHMDFEQDYDNTKVQYKFIGNPTNKFMGYGFDYADGILISIENPEIKLKLKNGFVTSFNI